MSKLLKRICDECGKEIKNQFFFQLNQYEYGNAKGNPEIRKDLDFCDKSCLREWSNKGSVKER